VDTLELLIQICDVVAGARPQPLWGRLKQRSFTPERCLDHIRDHRDIYEALLDRDSATARSPSRHPPPDQRQPHTLPPARTRRPTRVRPRETVYDDRNSCSSAPQNAQGKRGTAVALRR
jgi:FCD domain